MTRVDNYLIVTKYTDEGYYNMDNIRVVSGKNMKEAIETVLELNRETFKGKKWCIYSITKLDSSVKSFDDIHGEE